MFIRFVTRTLDPRSGRRQGIFEAGGALRTSERMSAVDIEKLDEIRDWFIDHLPIPTRFSLSPKPHRKAQGISWFKDGASVYIGRMREYQSVLELYDVGIEMLRTDRPGYIVYEDDHQVVAYPFANTPC
jgi:hypothetical protein